MWFGFGIGASLPSQFSPAIAFSSRRDRKASIGVSPEKSSVCTADELHFVSVPNSDWSLALWRYLPSPKVKNRKNHPLLLLSGIATNAIGYDLSPECSFARYMSGNGFDTWILELRGSGLSTIGLNLQNVQNLSLNSVFENERSVGSLGIPTFADIGNGGTSKVINRLLTMTNFSRSFTPMSENLPHFLSEGLNSVIGTEIKDKHWRVNALKENQRLVPPNLFGPQKNILSWSEEFQRQFQLVFKYDWDFDNLLEEDLPAAMAYIKSQCKPEDGKLHAIGHSMGGILLYSRLSQYCSKGKDSGLASITALASSLDYSTSRSSLKLLLPMADPVRALNVPAIPIGVMLAAIHPFVSYPPYLLSWLKGQVSAHEMMRPDLYEKLLLNNFCTIPSKLLLQLATAFYKGGLQSRNGTLFYKNHLQNIDVPVLIIGGDQDRICPPEAVYETTKHIPEHMLTLKILGEPGGPHYAHYDVVGSHLAAEQVYPRIIEFLNRHDS